MLSDMLSGEGSGRTVLSTGVSLGDLVDRSEFVRGDDLDVPVGDLGLGVPGLLKSKNDP